MNSDAQMQIRPIRPKDGEDWLRLRCDLWPEGAEDHSGEIAAFFAGPATDPLAVFVAESGGRCIAIMELAIRENLPDHAGEKVGYVEGLYVVPEFRERNVAKHLLRAAQAWAREQQCVAFASDRAERLILDLRYRL